MKETEHPTLFAPRGWRGFFRVSLYRNAVFLIAANIINALFGFVFWIVAARFYTEEAVGLGSASIAAMQLLVNLSGLGLTYGVIRYLPSAPDPRRLVNTMITVGVLAAVAAGAIFLAGAGLWTPALLFLRSQWLYILLFILFAAIFQLSGLVNSIFIATRRSGFAVTQSLIFGGAKIVLVVLLAAGLGVFGILSSWAIATALALSVCFLWLVPRALPRYRPAPALSPGILKTTAGYAAGNYLAQLLWSAPAQVMPLLIVHSLGAGANAHYYVAFSIAGILNAVPLMAATALLAEGSYDPAGLRRYTVQSLKLSFLVLVPAVVLVLIAAGYLLWPFGAGYGEAAGLLRLLALASLPQVVVAAVMGKWRVEIRVKPMVLMSGLVAALVLAVGYLLLPLLGLEGAGLGWLVGMGAAAALCLLSMAGIRKVENWRNERK